MSRSLSEEFRRLDEFVAGVREECDLYPDRLYVRVGDLRALLVRLEEEGR